MNEQVILPKFIACRLDISEYCEPSFLERCGGKVYLSGFFDDNLDTYICSSKKMVFVHTLSLVPESYPENEEDAEKLICELMEDVVEDGGYYSRSEIELLRQTSPENFKELGKFNFDNEEPSDVVLEHLQGNPLF